MNKSEVIAKLDYFNNWRRGEDLAQPDPKKIGEVIDEAIKLLKGIK